MWGEFFSDMKSQQRTDNKRRNCPVSAQSSVSNKTSKSKVAYWRNRLEKVKSKKGTASPDYSARIVFQNKRVRFPLQTPNKEAAASKAAIIYKHVVAHGWDETLKKFKDNKSATNCDSGASVGDVISTVTKYSTVRPQTLKAYVQGFRKIVSDVAEISDEGKHGTNGNDGNQVWREKVDSVPLSQITPLKVQGWRQQRISVGGMDASAVRHATVTANSQIRNAKALFSKKLIPFLQAELELPKVLPFEDIQAEKTGSLRYHSRIDAKQLMTDAQVELKTQHPEVYKIFLLALVCGLRVSEIDHLLWDAIDLEKMTLHVRSSAYHTLKSEDSEGIIDLSESTTLYFKECVSLAFDQFVVEVSLDSRASESAPYRTQQHLAALRKWLREKGIKSQKPIHTLRKEIGSLIASEQGIYAASRYLRHADIQVTAGFYADKKTKILPQIAVQ